MNSSERSRKTNEAEGDRAQNLPQNEPSKDSLTPAQLQHWLDSQPSPQTKEESANQKRVKRLIRLSKDEEDE